MKKKKRKIVYILYINAEITGAMDSVDEDGYERLGTFSTRKKAIKETKELSKEHDVKLTKDDWKIEKEIVN